MMNMPTGLMNAGMAPPGATAEMHALWDLMACVRRSGVRPGEERRQFEDDAERRQFEDDAKVFDAASDRREAALTEREGVVAARMAEAEAFMGRAEALKADYEAKLTELNAITSRRPTAA